MGHVHKWSHLQKCCCFTQKNVFFFYFCESNDVLNKVLQCVSHLLSRIYRFDIRINCRFVNRQKLQNKISRTHTHTHAFYMKDLLLIGGTPQLLLRVHIHTVHTLDACVVCNLMIHSLCMCARS